MRNELTEPARPSDALRKTKVFIRRQLIPRIRITDKTADESRASKTSRQALKPLILSEKSNNSRSRSPLLDKSNRYRTSSEFKHIVAKQQNTMSFAKIKEQLTKRPAFLRLKQSKRKIVSVTKLERKGGPTQFNIHMYQNSLHPIQQTKSIHIVNSPYSLATTSSEQVLGLIKSKIPTLPLQVRHKWENNTFTMISIATFGRKKFKMQPRPTEGTVRRAISDNVITPARPVTPLKWEDASREVESMLAAKSRRFFKTKTKVQEPLALVSQPLPQQNQQPQPHFPPKMQRSSTSRINHFRLKSASGSAGMPIFSHHTPEPRTPLLPELSSTRRMKDNRAYSGRNLTQLKMAKYKQSSDTFQLSSTMNPRMHSALQGY